MSMRLDGGEVLRRIVDNPDIFAVATSIDDVARKLVISSMKKAATLAEVKTICAVLGDGLFKSVADGMTDADAKSILAKVDKENKEAKAAGGAAQRVLLVELATGHVEPRAKIVKQRAPKTSADSEAGKALKGKAPGARRKASSKP